MFCDLVNSTGLAGSLDPEDLLQIIKTYRHLCSEIIECHDGFVAHFTGDGVMAFFGYPRTREDDAERAVGAALDLLSALKMRKTAALDQAWNRISIRIGIASGLVVLGDPYETVIGETPNLAARLQAVAQPGTTIISNETRCLVRNAFRLQDRGLYALRGYEKLFRLWQVIGSTGGRSFSAAQISPAGPVGRHGEFRQLMELWQPVRLRQGRVALVSGDTGTGKSMLLEAFCRHVAGTCSEQLYLRCPAAGDVLRPQLAQLLAAMELVRRPAPARNSRSGHPATTSPYVVVLEDTQRLSAEALALLDKLVALVTTRPIFLAISHRTRFEPPPHWRRWEHVKTIYLAPLSRVAAAAFIRHVAGSACIPACVAEEIITRGEGIPLFLTELTAGATGANVPATPGKLDIPEKVRTLLMARLDRQPFQARQAAQVGAALGREFDYPLIRVLWPYHAQQLEAALETLCRSEVLVQRGTGVKARYRFKWALMQEVAYQGTLKQVRLNLRKRINSLGLH